MGTDKSELELSWKTSEKSVLKNLLEEEEVRNLLFCSEFKSDNKDDEIS